MTDRELIKKIVSYSIIYVDDCTKEEKQKLNKILVKLAEVDDRLSIRHISATPAFYISGGYISYSSNEDYPMEYCKDTNENESILLFSEDIYLLDEIYENNNNTTESINKILSIDINNRIKYKAMILEKRIKNGK
jgi:hypothetical protein